MMNKYVLNGRKTITNKNKRHNMNDLTSTIKFNVIKAQKKIKSIKRRHKKTQRALF